MTTTHGDHSHHTTTSNSGLGHEAHGGDDKHAGRDPEMFRRLFWWNLVLAVPVLVFSEQIRDWFDYFHRRALAAWVAPVTRTRWGVDGCLSRRAWGCWSLWTSGRGMSEKKK